MKQSMQNRLEQVERRVSKTQHVLNRAPPDWLLDLLDDLDEAAAPRGWGAVLSGARPVC